MACTTFGKPPMKEKLPLYQCHKRVRAAKIIGMIECLNPNHESYGRHGFMLRGQPMATYLPDDWFPKNNPAPGEFEPFVGGWLVEYADGYISWSPAKAFEEGYTLVSAIGDTVQAAIDAHVQDDDTPRTLGAEAKRAEYQAMGASPGLEKPDDEFIADCQALGTIPDPEPGEVKVVTTKERHAHLAVMASAPLAQKPTIGRCVHYCLTKANVAQIRAQRKSEDNVGNPVHHGQIVPMTIVAVWVDGKINGQCILDGNDSLWLSTIGEGEEQGQWFWPPRG